MVDFINEVEEELRKDQYNALLRKWGPLLVALAVAVVVGAGIFEFFKSSDSRAAKSTSISYMRATELAEGANKNDSKNVFLAIADNARPGYAGLSLMQAAAISLENNNSAEAIELYDRASQTFETDIHIQLATLKAAYLRADLGQYDDVTARLSPLAETGQPFEYLARELKGFVALEQGDIEGAKLEFSYLARSPDVSTGIQSRAEQVLALSAKQALAAQSEPTDAALEAPATDTTPEPEDNIIPKDAQP